MFELDELSSSDAAHVNDQSRVKPYQFCACLEDIVFFVESTYDVLVKFCEV